MMAHGEGRGGGLGEGLEGRETMGGKGRERKTNEERKVECEKLGCMRNLETDTQGVERMSGYMNENTHTKHNEILSINR